MKDPLKIILNGFVLTGDAVRRSGPLALLIRAGRIAEIVPSGDSLRSRYPQAEVVDAAGCVLLPGFVDPHLHGESVLLRHVTAGRPLSRWDKDPLVTGALNSFYAETSPADLQWAYDVAYYSAMRSGITTIAEFGFDREDQPLEACIEAARRTGVRAVLGIHNGEQVETARLRHLPGIDFAMILPNEDQLTVYGLQSAMRSVRQEGWSLVLSSGETRKGTDTLKRNFARSALQIAQEYRLFDHAFQLHHQAHYDPGDLEALAEAHIPIAISPLGILAKGVELPPLAELARLQIPIALATDWGYPDALGSARCFAHVTASIGLPPRSADELLAMITSIPARALRLDSEVGSLEPGKRADIVFVDMSGLRHGVAGKFGSAESVAEEVMSNASADRITHVMANGEFVARGGRLQACEEEGLVRESLRLLRLLGAFPDAGGGPRPEPVTMETAGSAPVIDLPGDEGFRVIRRGAETADLPPAVFPLPERRTPGPELSKNVRRAFGDDDES